MRLPPCKVWSITTNFFSEAFHEAVFNERKTNDGDRFEKEQRDCWSAPDIAELTARDEENHGSL
jgi:hypothetical protein